MVNVAMDMPGKLYAHGIELALRDNAQLRSFSLQAGTPETMILECREQGADVALLGVSLTKGYSAHEREGLLRALRQELPACRVVLLVDDSVSEQMNEEVKELKQSGLADMFVYTTAANFSYLAAVLETI